MEYLKFNLNHFIKKSLRFINLLLVKFFKVRLVKASIPNLREINYKFTIPYFDLRIENIFGKINGGSSPYPQGHLSVLTEDLPILINKSEFQNKRILEIGPKFGYHSLWIDKELNPRAFCMLDLERARDIDHSYVNKLKCKHTLIWDNLLTTTCFLEMEPFDLIFFTGILYHNVEPFKMLHKLWTLAKPGALLVFESTVTPLEDSICSNEAIFELRWHGKRQGDYLLPSRSAILTMLAMTGWNDIKMYMDYKTIDPGILLTCQKSNTIPTSYNGSIFGNST